MFVTHKRVFAGSRKQNVFPIPHPSVWNRFVEIRYQLTWNPTRAGYNIGLISLAIKNPEAVRREAGDTTVIDKEPFGTPQGRHDIDPATFPLGSEGYLTAIRRK